MEGRGAIFIIFDPRFARGLKHLSLDLHDVVQARIRLFRADPFLMQLRTHKLRGNLKGRWAFSVNSSHRIIFRFVDSKTVIFHAIGPHDIYDKFG